jgi:hypothetical protein
MNNEKGGIDLRTFIRNKKMKASDSIFTSALMKANVIEKIELLTISIEYI